MSNSAEVEILKSRLGAILDFGPPMGQNGRQKNAKLSFLKLQ